jgi:mannosyl-oligosaccharide glucosidase
MARQGAQLSIPLALTALVSLFALFAAHAEATNDGSILIAEVGRQNNESLLWGPYKPNLYFGVQPRIPKSLMAGLMWGRVDNFQDIHTCWCPALPPPP